jgi:hypothetical protein
MTHPKPFGELTTAEKGELLLAHHEGKRIEILCGELWTKAAPTWAEWKIYRIAPEPLVPDSINWDHVAPEWKWLARDENGKAYLFAEKPRMVRTEWISCPAASHASSFASYRRGTVDWRDSLVIRPGHESSKS